jgi:hypothetical protein
MIRSILIICVIGIQIYGFASSDGPDSLFKKNYVQDPTYIDDLHGKISFKLYTLNRTNSFSISDVDNKFVTNYEPNVGADLGFGVLFRWLKLGVSFAKLGKNGPESTHGETTRFDLQGHMFTKKVGADLNLQFYNGFYMSNPAAFNKDWKSGDPYPQRSDIRTISIGTSVYYVFNHEKFSLQSVYVQSEWQKKSAGSFFLGSSLNTFAILADSAISPENFSNPTNQSKFFEEARLRSLAPLLGYSYTLVLSEHVFTNLTLSPGLALANTRLKDAVGLLVYNKTNIIPRFGIRFGLGYNGPKFFGGFSAEYNYQQFRFNSGEGRFGYTRGQARVYVGYRLNW